MTEQNMEAATLAMEERLREIYQSGKGAGIIVGLQSSVAIVERLRVETRRALLSVLPEDDARVHATMQAMEGVRNALQGTLAELHAGGPAPEAAAPNE